MISRRKVAELAELLQSEFKETEGFALFVFDEENDLVYVSDADREDVVAMLKQFLALQQGSFFQGDPTTLN